MSRPRTFLKCEIDEAARTAAELGVAVRLLPNGEVEHRELPFSLDSVLRLKPLDIPKPRDNQPYVYFLRCQQFVKIGTAKDIEKRLIQFRCGSPFPIDLIAYVDGGRREEGQIQGDFWMQHQRGEWFLCDQFLYDYIVDVREFTLE